MTAAPSRVTLAAFGGTVLIGGSNFVAVKFSNDELAPLYGAAIRFTGAAAIFWLLTLVLSVPLPRGRAALGDAVYGALAVGAAYALLYFALTEITIGIAAVIMATVPLFTLVLAVFHGQERLTVGGVVGALLAIVGIGVLSLASIAGAVSALHMVAAVGAAAAVAESSVLVKGFPRAHPVTTNAIGMVTGGLLLWAGSALMSE
ncbi:MAG: EamA family transporter, partial [Pseudonocardiaceae bacterium]